MTTRTCPDWPQLMEIAPDLQFKHYSLLEAKLPPEAIAGLGDISLMESQICCDLEHNVFHAAHTEPRVVEGLRSTYWFELAEWSTQGPGAAALR